MFMKWIASVLVNALILIVVSGYFGDDFYISSVWAAILASMIISVLNVIVKPFLVLLTLPVTILSLGLFLFVINAITLMITQSLMGDSFNINSFGMAVIAAIIISILQLLIQKIIINPLQDKK
ncbi:phage holin family protein [Bacillus carboniphilus]|uniref:Phage holin family protein n=1 Tax=Bacillus carboniphilus TaxID=86663 RepID=A0ABY9JPZ5_9BACI|nr:phage holin family protein [Bacillus carboniphilus]WLR41467.1 phage holin family protein [Bacillus carboniphilus]